MLPDGIFLLYCILSVVFQNLVRKIVIPLYFLFLSQTYNAAGVANESEVVEGSTSLDETASSVDFELQNEVKCTIILLFYILCPINLYMYLKSDEKRWQRTGSVNSSVADHSVGSSDRIEVTKPSIIPPTPSKQIEQGIILKQLVLKGITSQLETAQVAIFLN